MKLLSSFGTSWKTTLAGTASLLVAAMQTYNSPSIGAAVHDPRIQTAVLIGLLGLFAKDHDVSGGTVSQPSSPQVIADTTQAPVVEVTTTNPPKAA